MIINCFGFLITTYLAIFNFQIKVVVGEENQKPCTFCDDGKTDLQVDWNDSTILLYTCYESHKYIPNPNITAIEYYDPTVKCFEAKHFCMDKKIEYKVALPTYGDSRPVWAHYGEYKFLPPQRGFHNLENGAIVMLYHPCADENEVTILRNLVKHCLRRYIITPYTGLSKERPLVLLSWGRYLQMNTVDAAKAKEFIRNYAITHAPENIGADGAYDYALLEKPLQKETCDLVLCPENK